MRALRGPLLATLMPEGALLLAALLFARHAYGTETGGLFLDVFPWAVLVVGLALGARFGRTRLLFSLSVIGLALAGLRFAPWIAASEPDGARVAMQAIALLVPANLVGVALISERGLFTRAGLARLSTIGAQAALVILAARAAREDALRFLSLAPFPEKWLAAAGIGQVATLAFVAGFVVLLTRVLLSREPFARSLLWALAASFFGLGASAEPAMATLYLSTAGLMLVVGTMESAHAMAFRDELTGLPSRRALTELLERLAEPYTVAMVDVDHFKQFNDRHGHDVGDQVLRMVAARLRDVQGGGRAFRYGGEEFTIVFPGTPMDDALPHLEAVRRAIHGSPFTLRNPGRPRRPPKRPGAGRGGRGRLKITVSIGAAQRSARLTGSDQVIRAADLALYRAKDAGRNQVAT